MLLSNDFQTIDNEKANNLSAKILWGLVNIFPFCLIPHNNIICHLKCQSSIHVCKEQKTIQIWIKYKGIN